MDKSRRLYFRLRPAWRAFGGRSMEKNMTDSREKKKANTVNPIVAGIAGVVAGGVAVAAALVMSDKKNQKKVKDALVDAKEKVTDYIDTKKKIADR